MKDNPTVVIAMSGGVDSSVAAALLDQQGYRVIGMMLRLWSETGFEENNRCCTPDAMALARRVAAKFNIPFYVVDAKDIFHEVVVNHFIQAHAEGQTPNPCIACNRTIRWDFLLKQALDIGADYLATGHYAQLSKNESGEFELKRAIDLHKDQSYVLHVLGQEQLSHALFPLGEFTKTHVRELAHRLSIPVADRPDSQDLCFLGGGDYRSFLMRQAPFLYNPGLIVNKKGLALGEHKGLSFYTIGQRKGLGIASPEPYYVLEKDSAKNLLYVGTLDELGKDELTAKNVHWISKTPPQSPFWAEVKIRYKAHLARGLVTILSDQEVQVKFSEKLRDITPGQAAVFYSGEVCLGGGTIQA